VHGGVREREAGVTGRDPAVVIEVKVGHGDDVDVGRLDPDRGQLVEQVAADEVFGRERAEARVDQHRPVTLDEEATDGQIGAARGARPANTTGRDRVPD
jgi:hypothetical protein